ncbi:unnamed protein product, partial [Symbiodinium microadriaticum]
GPLASLPARPMPWRGLVAPQRRTQQLSRLCLPAMRRTPQQLLSAPLAQGLRCLHPCESLQWRPLRPWALRVPCRAHRASPSAWGRRTL